MGQRGPKKKSTRRKQLEVTERKKTAKDVEPQLCIPKPPKFLSAAARREWRRISSELFELKLLSNIDTTALAAYCDFFVQFIEARKQVEEHGMVMEVGEQGYQQISPYFTAMLKLADQVKKYLVEFGMTPSSRSGLKVKDPRSTDSKSKLSGMRNRGRRGIDET